MSNAKKDANRINTMTGVQDTDNSVIVNISANETSHRLQVTYQGTDGVSNDALANRDENNMPVLMAASSSDGVTPVELLVTSDGKLLI